MKVKDPLLVRNLLWGALVGAACGWASNRWISPLIGGQCRVICRQHRAIVACALLGMLLAWLIVRAQRERAALAARPDGAKILSRRRQARTLWIGAVFIALMTVYPPWTITRWADNGMGPLADAGGYRLIWESPSVKKGVEAASVDVQRLAIQWALVAVVTGVAVAAQRLKEQPGGRG